MKTPSSLALVFLAAALPAAAAPKAGARCDVEWLEKTQAVMSQSGRSVTDERIEVVGDVVKLKPGHASTCDAGTWRQLGAFETGQPPKWHKPAAGDFWKDTAVAQHIGLVLAVSDFYGAVDAKAAAVIAAADEVIDAGKAMGFADFKVSEKSLGELSKGASGGPIGAVKPRLVTVFEKGKQVPAAIAQEQLGPTMRKLVADGPTLGDAVVKFRVAVLALEAELGRLGKSDAFLKKRVSGGIQGLTDFTFGLPDKFVLVPADKAAALNKDKYKSALDALIGPGALPELGDAGPRAPALLDSVDPALRNLVAIRSAEVDKIHAAAVERLGGKSLVGYEVANRATADAKGATPMGAAAMKALAGTKEYAELDALYDATLKRKGAADPETLALGRAREEMKTAALSTTLESDKDGRQAIVFTQNGRRASLGSIVPPKEGAEGDAARENVADVVARFIVEGAKQSDSYRTVAKAVLGGDAALSPGGLLPTGVTAAEIPVSKEVPPAVAKINADGAGCKDPRDVYRNNFESYAARKQKAAAEMASGNARSRSEIEDRETKEKAASEAECARRKDAAAKLQADSFTPAAELDARRADATRAAQKWCDEDMAGIKERAAKAIKALEAEMAKDGKRDKNVGLKAANADLDSAFSVAIAGSASALRKEYTTPGSSRVKKLMADAKLNALSQGKLIALNNLWFAERWPEGSELVGSGAKVEDRKKALEASIKSCKESLGFKPMEDEKSKVSYGNPENPGTVADKCGIERDLLAWVESQKPKAPAPKAEE